MQIPDEIEKCICLIAAKIEGEKYKFYGTGFFVSIKISETESRVFVITARHVIDKAAMHGANDIYLRLNNTSGKAAFLKTDLIKWKPPTDKSVDLMALPCAPKNCDYKCIPLNMFVDSEVQREQNVSLGDEVFVMGMFANRLGESRNLPIARIGNVASFGEEKIRVKTFGDMDAHLIECRSIGGISGSPVFLQLGNSRLVNNNFVVGAGPSIYLLGVIHGHYDSYLSDQDTQVEDSVGKSVGINTGIAIVTPAEKARGLIETYHEEITKLEQSGEWH